MSASLFNLLAYLYLRLTRHLCGIAAATASCRLFGRKEVLGCQTRRGSSFCRNQ